jgi:transmembrane sensor
MDVNDARTEMLRAAERAAEWLCTLEDAGPDELSRFADWVRESPLHAREFLLMSAVDGELARMDPQRRLHVEALLAAAGGNVVPITTAPAPASAPTSAPFRGEKRRHRYRSAAAAVAVIGAMAVWWSFDRGQIHQTAAGEQRVMTLADGSSIHLGMKSRIEVSLRDDAREVTLHEGAALFKVAPDPQRPFRVLAGRSAIQAIGTQFNVNRRPASTTVSVVEGRVQISASHADSARIHAGTAAGPDPGFARLGAGEEARIARDGRIERRGHIDPQDIATWKRRPLVFRDEALEDIAAEFNRHNRDVRIEVEGDEARAHRYTAVFESDDPGSLLQFLEEENELEVLDEGRRVLVRRRGR